MPDSPSLAALPDPGPSLLPERPRIDIDDLDIELGRTRILNQVSLSLTGGRLFGLIGPNGAGKSTLLRAICGLIAPAAGAVRLNGRPTLDYGRRALARQIGYLPQGHQMHWPLRVEQLVTLGRLPHLSPFDRAGEADQAAVTDAMARADVAGLKDRAADTLSGGERARVMLARVLASEAPILLADEPVVSLDPYHQLQVMELMQTLADEGRLVVCVLHDLSLAARFCSHLVLMHEGRIAAEGPAEKVLAPAPLTRAYKIEALYGCEHDQRYVLPWRRRSAADA